MIFGKKKQKGEGDAKTNAPGGGGSAPLSDEELESAWQDLGPEDLGPAAASENEEAFLESFERQMRQSRAKSERDENPAQRSMRVQQELLSTTSVPAANISKAQSVKPKKEATRILTTKPTWGKSVRLLKVGDLEELERTSRDIKTISGGALVQDFNRATYEKSNFKVVTKKKPTDKEMEDLKFAWVICKHLKSNAIALVRDKALVGAGAGQMSRLDSAMIAVRKAGGRAEGSVLASDAFFPFPDALEEAIKAGITAAIQPGGAKNDNLAIEAADKANISMVFTGMRHFKH